MTDAPDADERIQTIRCIDCDRLSLVGDCHSDDHRRLQCPRCGARVPVEAIHEYTHESVTKYYE